MLGPVTDALATHGLSARSSGATGLNEGGAHHVGAKIYHALIDLGFSVAANALTYA